MGGAVLHGAVLFRKRNRFKFDKKDVKYENNNKEVGEYLIHVWGGEDFTSIKATEKNC